MAQRVTGRTRERVILPGRLIERLPSVLRYPRVRGDMDEPHQWRGADVLSYRQNDRSHHRIILAPRREERYYIVPVEFEYEGKYFEEYLTQVKPLRS